MQKLSVTIITKNEEANIKECIDSLKLLNAEIIVVDSRSTDSTLDIAKKLGAKIYQRDFDNFANQKNYALEKASGEWIFSIDADERITQELAEEMLKSIKSEEYSAFLIPRRNFILGGEIKHSRWSPDVHIWLWKKEVGSWVGEVHEEVKVSGRVGKCKWAKLHYQEKNVSGFLMGNDFYSEILSKQLYRSGVRFSWFHLIYDPLFEFFLRFIYKFGFLDGWRGFVLSYLMAIFKISIWIRVYEYSSKPRL